MGTALERGYDAYLLAGLTATYSALVQRRIERRFGARSVPADVLYRSALET